MQPARHHVAALTIGRPLASVSGWRRGAMRTANMPLKTLVFGLTSAAMLWLTAVTGSAAAGGLRDHRAVNDGLAIIASADMIRKNCGAISARMLNAWLYARSLRAMAREAGFSDAELKTYIKDKPAKARVKSNALAYLVSKGVDPAVARSYCSVGRYEIDRNSQIGVLLRAK